MHSLSLRSWNGELNTSSKLVLSIRDIPIHATEVVRLSSATVNYFFQVETVKGASLLAKHELGPMLLAQTRRYTNT